MVPELTSRCGPSRLDPRPAPAASIEKVDADSSTDWFVMGLIPTTEHVLDGMKALGEWHQPVVIHGSSSSPQETQMQQRPGLSGQLAQGEQRL